MNGLEPSEKLGLTGWRRTETCGLPIYVAEEISSVPGLAQAFTTRYGGYGQAPYDTLNNGLNCGDDPEIVAANRLRVADALGYAADQCVFANQVHGRGVEVVRSAPKLGAPLAQADAFVTATPGLLLVLQFADCFPVYIVDPVKRVIALAHSGWRGTAENIVQAVTDVLKTEFAVDPSRCLAAVGPGIAGMSYEVGEEVAVHFAHGYERAARPVIERRLEGEGKWSLHVQRAIYCQLLEAGYEADRIAVCEEDTFANSQDFFSHRRESLRNLKTGRMAGVLGLRW